MNKNFSYNTVSYDIPGRWSHNPEKQFHKDEKLNKFINIFLYASKYDIIKLYAVYHFNRNTPYSKHRYEIMIANNKSVKNAKEEYKKILKLNDEISAENLKRIKKKRLLSLPYVPYEYSDEDIEKAKNQYMSDILEYNKDFNFNYYKVRTTITTVEEW